MPRLHRTAPFLVPILLAACDRETPTAPSNEAVVLLSKVSESFTRSSYVFQNRTGQPASRLVIEFNAQLTEVIHDPFPLDDVNGSSLVLHGFALPSGVEARVRATVKAKNIRITGWHWAAADGSVIGGVNKNCNEKQNGCKEMVLPQFFRIVSPSTAILASQVIAYCYHFRTPNTETLAIRSWRARMPAAAARMHLVFSEADVQPPGTQSAANCTPLLGPQSSAWAFSAYNDGDAFTFPTDDGTGTPLGLTLPPNQPGYLYILYQNATDSEVTAHVELEFEFYDTGATVTPANRYIAWNNSLVIPAQTLGHVQSQSCDVPGGANFFWLSTYAHALNVRGTLRDGAATVFESTNPHDPGFASPAPPFYSFASGQLTYEFEYDNPTNREVRSGASYDRDEIGAALTYFFPATSPRICFDGFLMP
jgi:hypothetical protein